MRDKLILLDYPLRECLQMIRALLIMALFMAAFYVSGECKYRRLQHKLSSALFLTFSVHELVQMNFEIIYENIRAIFNSFF